MVEVTNQFEDLVPGSHPSSENRFADLIPTDTETPLPTFFEKFTDKKAYIGTSDIQEDYEDITEDLGSFDKFFFQTILGNEEVFRQKKSEDFSKSARFSCW